MTKPKLKLETGAIRLRNIIKALDSDLFEFVSMDIALCLRLSREMDASDSISTYKAQQLRLVSESIRSEARRWWAIHRPSDPDIPLSPEQELFASLFG